MAGNCKACEDCTQNCVLMHKQQNASQLPPVTRFFKIMVDDDYSKALFLPPHFVRSVETAIGPQTHLEDSSGRQWPVTVSYINGSLAFQKGWNEFSRDHGLQVGEFLIFSHIKDSHFIVQIFGLSGTERLNFNCRRGQLNKRSRETKEKMVPDEPLQTVEKTSTVKACSSTSVQHADRLPMAAADSDSGGNFAMKQFIPTDISMDDPVVMLNRSAGYNKGEDRISLFDISIFEMGNNKTNAEETKNDTERVSDNSQKRKMTVQEVNDVMKVAKIQDDNDNVNVHFNGDHPPKEPAEVTNIVKGLSNLFSDFQNDNNNAVLGEQTIGVKDQLVEMEDVAFGLHQTSTGKDSGNITNIVSIVKHEPVEFGLASPFLVEVKSHSYLELPKSFQPNEGKRRGRKSQFVYLRDSASRLWPVRYTSTSNGRAFAEGWKQFTSANNILLGDFCEMKHEKNCIWCISRILKSTPAIQSLEEERRYLDG